MEEYKVILKKDKFLGIVFLFVDFQIIEFFNFQEFVK